MNDTDERLPDGDRLLTLKEVQRKIRVFSEKTLRRRVDEGLLRPINPKGKLIFRETEVMKFLRRMEGGSETC